MDDINLDSLVPVPEARIDRRSDEEILRQLKAYCSPMTGARNVWAYWHTGFDTMPPWIKRNIVNWVRKLGCSWKVRVVDSVPGSPTNVYRFVDKQFFPDSYNRRAMTGPFVGQLSSDFVRLSLLLVYGGVWMDVSIILIRHLDDIWSSIADPLSPHEMAAMTMPLRPDDEHSLVNGFIAARNGNEFIRRWHQIFLAVWENRTECTGLHAHPLLRHLKPFVPPSGESRAPDIRWTAEGMTDYLTHMLCAERLRDLDDIRDGFNGRLYFETHILRLPALREMHYFQLRSGWDGPEEFRLLSARYDSSSINSDEAYFRARDVVIDMLKNTSMIKLPHGPNGITTPWLADIWNQTEHQHADNQPGTFASYLRQKILEFDQSRKLIPLAPTPLSAKLWKASLLDPCGDGVNSWPSAGD
ncbi:putative capsule polysaccharide biosynthesis protein [Xylaria sp. FL0933]|nr:putative capsule polysaccharide biosynthesis protein [Xylaria sp. FL0933]